MIGPFKVKGDGSQAITEQVTGSRYGGKGHEEPGVHATMRAMLRSHAPPQPADEEEGEGGEGKEACMEEFLAAVHAKDVSRAVEAFDDLFELWESEPHEEGPHY